ncbi:Leucine aminopeptidase 1 [Claviceps citrina]|nr:Leucine aminopeptidase 1 [Claviceps citrina]
MKFTHALLAAGTPLTSARFFQQGETDNVVLDPYEKFLIETAPGETQWVTEEEKWELRRNGLHFMDITATRDLGMTQLAAKTKVKFPDKCVQRDAVAKLVPALDKKRMRGHLQKLTGFHTRYYNSDYGRESSEWVLGQVTDIIKRAGAEPKVTAKSFPHTWKQSSVIATIPGRSNKTIVVGAHQDSINLWLPVLAAPGADDDGSGTVTIMEVFAALLQSDKIVAGKAENTVEFHWYSAEEGGLLGSQAVFKEYESRQRDVKAMLQQDMTGFTKGTLDAGLPESVGVVVDFVDAGLTTFIKLVIEQYCRLPWAETKCGYACSDHASASKAGYPSAFVIESLFEKSNQDIHTTSDTIDRLSFDHMLEHAKMTLGFAYELAFYDFGT